MCVCFSLLLLLYFLGWCALFGYIIGVLGFSERQVCHFSMDQVTFCEWLCSGGGPYQTDSLKRHFAAEDKGQDGTHTPHTNTLVPCTEADTGPAVESYISTVNILHCT